MVSQKTDEWETPANIFKPLDEKFHFTLDPCATDKNHKCVKYYTPEQDGLKQDWGGETAFINPPYSEAAKWIRKAVDESKKGNTCVLLIPARVDTTYWHDYCAKAEIWFLRGRLKFINKVINPKGELPSIFPSAVVIFRPGVVPKVRFTTLDKGVFKYTLDVLIK
jgi:site-specific DNA-methyltransferase (adenine-specific)